MLLFLHFGLDVYSYLTMQELIETIDIVWHRIKVLCNEYCSTSVYRLGIVDLKVH